VSFTSAAMIYPWYQHVHGATLSCASGGSSHSYTANSLSSGQGCYECEIGDSTHSAGSLALGSAGSADSDHTWTGTTGNADLAGTALHHWHPFSGTTSNGGSHQHASSGSSGYGTCDLGHNHNHTGNSSSTASHSHSFTGNSGTNGENEPPAPADNNLVYIV
jgi:hypothetical protein